MHHRLLTRLKRLQPIVPRTKPGEAAHCVTNPTEDNNASSRGPYNCPRCPRVPLKGHKCPKLPKEHPLPNEVIQKIREKWKTPDAGRSGGYACGKCGEKKKGHDCPRKSKPHPPTFAIADGAGTDSSTLQSDSKVDQNTFDSDELLCREAISSVDQKISVSLNPGIIAPIDEVSTACRSNFKSVHVTFSCFLSAGGFVSQILLLFNPRLFDNPTRSNQVTGA